MARDVIFVYYSLQDFYSPRRSIMHWMFRKKCYCAVRLLSFDEYVTFENRK